VLKQQVWALDGMFYRLISGNRAKPHPHNLNFRLEEARITFFLFPITVSNSSLLSSLSSFQYQSLLFGANGKAGNPYLGLSTLGTQSVGNQSD
jgi:hypothetical protein